MDLIVSLIVFLIIAAIVLWFVQYIVGNLPIDPPIRNLIVALAALLLLLAFLVQTGIGARVLHL